MTDLPPAGWHVDPDDPGQHRYWNGVEWTDHRAPRTVATAPTPAAAPSAQNGMSVVGIICGLVALLVLPPVLGAVGIVFSAIGISRREGLGVLALVISIAGLVIGVYLGAAVATS